MIRLAMILAVANAAAALLVGVFAMSADSAGMQRSSKSRVTIPNVPEPQLVALANGHRAFALKLYESVRAGDGNLVFSPYSITAALSMTLAGARGETAKQMLQAMGQTGPDADLNAATNAMDLALMRAVKGDGRGSDEQGRLSIANGLWVQEGEKLLPAYLDCLAENFGAGVGVLDFARQPDTASKTINDWVSHETQERITGLVSPAAVQQARLVLANAIYFKGFWSEPFKAAATSERPFHLLNGKSVDVPTMHQQETIRYAKQDDLEIAELTYKGGSLAMWLIVPAAGRLAECEARLDAARLKAAGDALAERPVALGLPKFKFTASLSLSQTLAAMGMPLAFSTGADFSGIDGKRDLFISDVIHKAFIQVDEKGTEAAAATGVVMATAVRQMTEPVVLTIDRPFLFAIVERKTGELLFLGRVTDPRGS